MTNLILVIVGSILAMFIGVPVAFSFALAGFLLCSIYGIRITGAISASFDRLNMYAKRIRTLKKKRTRLAQVKKDMKGIISEWLQIDTIKLNLRFTKIFLVIFGRSLIQALLREGLSESYQFKCSRFSPQADLLA